MKINLTLFKNWFEDNIDIELIVNKLTNIGFESFIEKNILNISIPNNRPNAENLLSILNELSKFYKIKQIENNYITDEIETDKIKILIKEKQFCPIYCYTIIENINNNMDTPLDIAEHLDLNDIKKHNFITDVLNFSTLITGQPLHAYDKTKIGNKIIIGTSEKNSTINTINNIKINIKKNDFIIYDNKENIISIPGKIGAFNSKIDKNTTSIVIESAYFSENEFKNTDIITQSSNIFKNIINLQLIKTSIIYTTNLINSFQKTKNKKIIEKKYNKYIPKKISIKIDKSYLLNFIEFDEKNLSLDQIFKKTELTFKTLKKLWKFHIPYHRTDLKIKENIISEIIKFYGYDKIKSLPINNSITSINKSYYIKKNNEDKTVTFLLSHGFNEIITYTFVDKHIEKLITEEDNIINIKNPMSETNNVLRTSLLQGILKVFKLNANKNNERIKLFEIGNVYEKKQQKINEKKQLICICEENDIINENKNYGCDINFFIIKKLVENVVTKIYKQNEIMFEKTYKNYLNENISANIFIKDKKIGEIGLLENNFLEKMSIKNNIFFFQIDLNFKNKNNIKIKAISKFPKIKRDISIILNKDISYSNLKIYIKSLKINDLKNITFMNIFEVTKDTNSINIRLTFQNHNRTLTDNEINSRTFFIIEMLKKKFILNHDNKV